MNKHLSASALQHPCEMYADHGAARPAITQGHHIRPVFLQNRLYDKIVYGDLMWLCGTCHDNLHAWLYWLLGERRVEPQGIPARAKRHARDVMTWYDGVLAAREAANA